MTITIDEAIRVNTVLIGAPVLKNDPLVVATLNLNIEGLKFIQDIRKYPGVDVTIKLPGETKE